jgi:hypothetical protein
VQVFVTELSEATIAMLLDPPAPPTVTVITPGAVKGIVDSRAPLPPV